MKIRSATKHHGHLHTPDHVVIDYWTLLLGLMNLYSDPTHASGFARSKCANQTREGAVSFSHKNTACPGELPRSAADVHKVPAPQTGLWMHAQEPSTTAPEGVKGVQSPKHKPQRVLKAKALLKRQVGRVSHLAEKDCD